MDTPLAPQDRPAFPEEAAAWLVGATPRTVVSLGSPEVTAALAAAGHEVLAPEGLPARLPYPDRSVDVVVASRGLPDDLDDVARVLRPGGHLALVWNDRDQRIPWARKLDRCLGTDVAGEEPAAALVLSPHFGFVGEHTWRWWEPVNHESLEALARAELAGIDAEERDRRVAAALALYADYGRGADGMQMPWVSRCFKATVVERPWQAPHAIDEQSMDVGRPAGEDRPADGPVEENGSILAPVVVDPEVQDAADSDLLLIDFR
jgi:SAM-dependent methyltransferase